MLDSIFKVVFLLGLVAAAVIRAMWVARARREQRRRPGAVAVDRNAPAEKPLLFLTFLGMQVIPLVYVFTRWLGFADYHVWRSLGWGGAALFAVALWLLWRSHADLGRSWSPTVEVRQEQSLVTHGVYRRVRHPMYTAHLLWGVAQVLLLQNWIAGPAFLVSQIPLYVLRIPREEQMMLAHFGEEYRTYMSRTGRLMPRPWG